ncbi:unnamed protein product, partial [Ectocarpus fasciculatus]
WQRPNHRDHEALKDGKCGMGSARRLCTSCSRLQMGRRLWRPTMQRMPWIVLVLWLDAWNVLPRQHRWKMLYGQHLWNMRSG